MGLADLPTLADDPRSGKAQPKPQKGADRLDRAETRRGIVTGERKNKNIARSRDKKCRFPHCPWCREIKAMVPQAAHVFHAKGIGGDPTLVRSQPEDLMLLCPPSHGAQERGEIDVEAMTTAGSDDVCAFYVVRDVYDRETGRYSSERVLWDRELSRGVPEHDAPLTKFDPIRRQKVQD